MEKGPVGGVENFKRRRASLCEKIKDGVGILFSNPEFIRNGDAHYPYRQDSTFYFMSGFSEPESVLVFCPGKTEKFIMFVREKDMSRELWDGFRYGLEGAGQYFGADKVYPIRELPTMLPEILKGVSRIHYRLNENNLFDQVVMSAVEKARVAQGRSGLGVPVFEDIKGVIGEMRLIKDQGDQRLQRLVCELTAKSHVHAMKVTRPGLFEYQVQAEIEKDFRYNGAQRLGYESIVATGGNATTLHYIFNSDKLVDGDLILIDAGAELNFLGGDITRTFPVNGKYTSAQKAVYDVVLSAQKSCIEMAKPGSNIEDIHQHAVSILVEGMIDLGLIKGSQKQKVIDEKTFAKYYPHRTSHWLGMDVHDVGLYKIDNKPRKFEPGMCLTIEPGLYIPLNDDSAHKEMRGIGIRIEDDILITKSGNDNLTISAPKETSEIESLVGTLGG